MRKLLGFTLPTLFLSALSSSAFATTGYFMHGYGVKAQGAAGASIAVFNDALTIANNPSGLAWLDSRVDIGATIFNPKRSAEIEGNLAGANGQYSGNGREYFVLPEFAINKQVNDTVALGLAIYGNGGMNTSYKKNPYAAFGNTGEAGVDLAQVFISPSVAWRYSENQSIGIATNILYQRFEAKGISASKIKSDKFDQYRGLFAQAGGFDVPESYGVGAAFQLTPALTVLTDIARINYSDVDSVGNPFSLASVMAGNGFGSEKGQGFGWKDINVYKIGAAYQVNPRVTIRAGYSHNDQPIPQDQTFLNILAPGVIQDHLSVGATWNIDRTQELSVAYTYGLKETVKGSQSIPLNFGGGEANLEMDQHILGVSYGLKF